jgi:PAS domain S-box-containing protein
VREVSCKAVRMIVEAVQDAGLDVSGLARGLPLTLAEITDPRARIDWDLFAEVLARVEALTRDVLTPEAIGERIMKVPSFDLLRRAGQLVVSPRQLYEIGTRLVAPALFPNVVVTSRWLASGRLVVEGALLPGYRESVFFFRVCHGNVAALPRALDLPPATIEEQTFTGRTGRLVLLPPPSHTLGVRLRRGARALGALGEGWRALLNQQRELEESLAALRTSRHELQQLLERLPDGVVIHQGGVFRWANAALAEILGVPSAEALTGRHLLDFVPADEREALALAMRRAAPQEIGGMAREYRVLRPDGSLRRVQQGTVQIVEFHGEQARLVVLRDVTEQQRLREQAAISDRLASIGTLAAGVAHEINNPLAYVRLSLEMASRHVSGAGEGAPSLEASLALAREGTERAIRIVSDLRMLSRLHDEPTEAVDVPALLDSTLMLAEGAIATKARVVRGYGATPLSLAPRGRLGQVFLNLLANAADAIPEGAPDAHVVRATTRTDAKGRAVVEITDSGGGIAPEIAHKVFDPFFTTKPIGEGTGLGLAICHRIVAELGGEITFESAPGATTFRVTLPAAAGAVVAPTRSVRRG